MENRFGVKDFFLLLLLCILMVLVWLAMLQRDREWSLLQSIQQQGLEQTRELTAIHRALQDGIAVAPTGGGTPAVADRGNDGFEHLRAAETQPGFARGDWLIDNFGTKVGKITPLVSSDLYADIVDARVIESLVYRDPDTLKFVPQLAKSWQISEDGLMFTFQLRKGVTFSDGEPFTADDVVYAFGMIMNPKIAAPRQRAYYDKVASVTKTNDFEVVFKMKEPYFEAMSVCGGISVIPKHFYSKFDPEDINTKNPGLLMGTGPYKMKDPSSWRPGQKLELVRNETYWGVPPTFDRVVYLEVQEEAAEETMFANGELDIFNCQPEQFTRLLKDEKTLKSSNHYQYSTPINGYSFIGWNQSRGGKATRFADARVRRAMTMLTDRARIAKDVYLGYAQVISGPFDAESPQADPAIKPIPFDPEGAKALLAEAGYKDTDGSGMLRGPGGEPFRIKLTYGNGNATFDRIVLLLKDGFAKAGIALDPEPVDWPILVKKLDTRDFEAISLAWGGDIESDLYQEFHSSQIKDQGDNFISYSNPELDKLVLDARRTVDDAKRMELWHKAHRILADDQPYTFLTSRLSLRFMDQRIRNVRTSKVGLNYIPLYSMPNPWYVPKGMQKYQN